MQFYFYIIVRKSNGHKGSTALSVLLHKQKLGLLEGLVLDVLEERLRHSVT
jgi:hypothetical protein